jgi:predicted HAD superfamily Cof-like phosphohydrolase
MSMYTDTSEFLSNVDIKQAQGPTLLIDDVMKARHKHMIEEANEFLYSNNMSDIHGCVDALIDVVYVALGTANMMGLTEEEFVECWRKVHIANMKKEAIKDKNGHKLGVVKPEGWLSPDFASVLGAE